MKQKRNVADDNLFGGLRVKFSFIIEFVKIIESFFSETTSEKFDQVAYRRFLEEEGVYDLGYWKRETTAGGLSSYGRWRPLNP